MLFNVRGKGAIISQLILMRSESIAKGSINYYRKGIQVDYLRGLKFRRSSAQEGFAGISPYVSRIILLPAHRRFWRKRN